MTTKKTAKKIQASEVEVGNRTLEAVLLDQGERATRALQEIADLNKRLDQHAEELQQQRAEMRQMMTAILTINQEHKGLAKRTEERLDALEKKAS